MMVKVQEVNPKANEETPVEMIVAAVEKRIMTEKMIEVEGTKTIVGMPVMVEEMTIMTTVAETTIVLAETIEAAVKMI